MGYICPTLGKFLGFFFIFYILAQLQGKGSNLQHLKNVVLIIVELNLYLMRFTKKLVLWNKFCIYIDFNIVSTKFNICLFDVFSWKVNLSWEVFSFSILF